MVSITEAEWRLRKLPYVKSLPYTEKVTAHWLISKGATATLLLFWHNITHRAYFPMYSVMWVRQDTDKMIAQHPELRDQIESWFRDYVEFLKTKNENKLFYPSGHAIS